MRIVSWDVGIKHLAYCLIEYLDEVKILEWGNINLLEDENLKCYGFINSENRNTNCDKYPKYEYINGSDKYYFCSLHKNQIEKIDKNNIDIQNYNGDITCEVIKSNVFELRIRITYYNKLKIQSISIKNAIKII